MAADLHIHALTNGATKDDLIEFCSNSLGSKWFNPKFYLAQDEEARKRIYETPGIFICEVSWLKAGLFDDDDTFIPDAAMQIGEIIGEELPILDRDLANKILAALDSENITPYDVSEEQSVANWLEEHMGEKLFTINW